MTTRPEVRVSENRRRELTPNARKDDDAIRTLDDVIARLEAFIARIGKK